MRAPGEIKTLKLKVGGITLGSRTVSVSKGDGKKVQKEKKTEKDVSRKRHRLVLQEDDEESYNVQAPLEAPKLVEESLMEMNEELEQENVEKSSIMLEEEEKMDEFEEEDEVGVSVEDEINAIISGKMTARQRAMVKQDPDASIEFPEGLVDKPSRKLSAEDTEADRLLKREEASRKRKQQMEKAARESQAMVIQKILGQDSSRKRREGRIQKQRLEAEKEREASEREASVNSIRLVQNAEGTIVSFSSDFELPPCFNARAEYPGPRQKCAGPDCSNPYRYRDSASRLPLCSLECYKAVRSGSS